MPEGVEHTWLLRHGAEPGTTTVLQDALTSTEWWPGTPFAWVAGGAATLASLRRWLRNREGPGPRADGGHRVLEAPIHDGLRGPRSPRRPRRARQPCGVRPERARARAARRAPERGPGPGWRGDLGGDHGQFLPARGGPRGRRRPLGQGADPRGPGGPPRARGALRPGAARAAGHGARGTRRAGGPAPSARAPPPDRPRTPAGRRGVRFPRRTAGVLRRGGPGHGAHPPHGRACAAAAGRAPTDDFASSWPRTGTRWSPAATWAGAGSSTRGTPRARPAAPAEHRTSPDR